MLLTRDEFREKVFERDNYLCIFCEKPAKDAHHIMERRLFGDSGYYLDNGASLCEEHHILAEKTLITCQDIRDKLNIRTPVLPEGYYSDVNYDKWGNILLNNGMRLRGELFYDESVQKILKSVLDQFTKYMKYPRTFHLPWSTGTKDDRFLKDDSFFLNKHVVVTEKLDGENTTFYNDYIHARSLEYDSHRSRDLIKKFHASISYNIPDNMRVCCENVTAVHSIKYEDLKHFCYGFSVWEDSKCLDWEGTKIYLELLGINTVPVLYEGLYNKELIHDIYLKENSVREIEGYVIRITDSFHFKDFKTCVGKFVRKDHISENCHNWKFKKVEYNNFTYKG